MKKQVVVLLSLAVFFFCFTALALNLRLPFPENDSWNLTRGYNVSSHIDYGYDWQDDRYALDFIESGCDSLGKPILAADYGVVEVQPYSGYGISILINHGDGYKTRYAHLDELLVNNGDFVSQGQEVGVVGNTGSVEGLACPENPGMHLHFALYHDGEAALPEPMSGYTNFTQGIAYTSNNSSPKFVYDKALLENSTCYGPVRYLPDWTAVCPGITIEFPRGYKVQSMFEINDISGGYRFKVETWNVSSTPSKAWEWAGDWQPSGSWQRAYFTPDFRDATVGDWEFRIFVDVDSDDSGWINIDSASFSVSQKNFYYDMYQYNGPYWGSAYSYKAYNCTGPIVGGSQTNWEYSCGGYIYDPFTYLSSGSLIRSDYTVGDDIFGLVKVRNITADFRFIADVYRNGVYQSDVVSGWNYVNGGMWDKAFFWPWEMPNQAGDWKFEVYLDELNGPETYLDTLNFIVWPTSTHPFFYQRNGTTCAGPVTGGQETNWWYTCENESSKFTAGETVHALAHVQNIYFNHRFKVEAYKNGTYQWSWTTDWNQVEPYTWGTSFFMPTLSNSTAGAWQFKVFIELADGGNNGFRQFDTINFDVL